MAEHPHGLADTESLGELLRAVDQLRNTVPMGPEQRREIHCHGVVEALLLDADQKAPEGLAPERGKRVAGYAPGERDGHLKRVDAPHGGAQFRPLGV